MNEGDIVQITDVADPWFPCLLVVSKVKSWGVQAYCIIPNSNDPQGERPGLAYRRIRFEKFEKVGRAVMMRRG